jgi:hypothetical protein
MVEILLNKISKAAHAEQMSLSGNNEINTKG